LTLPFPLPFRPSSKSIQIPITFDRYFSIPVKKRTLKRPIVHFHDWRCPRPTAHTFFIVIVTRCVKLELVYCIFTCFIWIHEAREEQSDLLARVLFPKIYQTPQQEFGTYTQSTRLLRPLPRLLTRPARIPRVPRWRRLDNADPNVLSIIYMAGACPHFSCALRLFPFLASFNCLSAVLRSPPEVNGNTRDVYIYTR
jgi:hypothetical protein